MSAEEQDTGRLIVVFAATSTRGLAAIKGLEADNARHFDEAVERQYNESRKRDLLASHGLSNSDAHLLPPLLPPTPHLMSVAPNRPSSRRFNANGFATDTQVVPAQEDALPNGDPSQQTLLVRAMEASLHDMGEVVDRTPRWVIRAVTRKPDSKDALELRSRGIDVVKADITQVDTLKPVLEGAYAVFLSPFCFWGWPMAMGILKAIAQDGGVVDMIAELNVKLVIYDGVEVPRPDYPNPPESMLLSQEVEKKLSKAVDEGKIGSYTVLDNVIPFELCLEGEWLTPVSRDGYFELDVLAPTDATLPFCTIQDISELITRIVNPPSGQTIPRHIDLCSDVLTPRELAQQLTQLIFVTSVKTIPCEHDMQAFENMRNEHYPGKEDGHDLVRYLLNTPRLRRPQRAASTSPAFRYTTWSDWSAERLNEILPDYPYNVPLTANLREASYLGDGVVGVEGQFHVPFAASDTNLELSRMIETARAQMEREGTLSGKDSTKVDDGLRYSMKVAW